MPDIAELRARLTATAADLKKGFADASTASDSLGSSFNRLKDTTAGVNQAVATTEQGLVSLKATSAGLSTSLQVPALADASRQTATLSQNVEQLTGNLQDASRGLSNLGQVPAGIAESGRAADATAGAFGRAATSAGSLANAASVVGRELVVVASGGNLTSEGIARLALSMGEAAVAAGALTAARPAETAGRIVEVFSQLAAINPSRTIADVATEAARLATTNPAAPLAAVADASARLAAANPAATIGEIAAAASQLVVAGAPAVSAMTQLGLALVKFSPLGIVAAVAGKLITDVLTDLTAAAETTSARVDAAFAKGAEGVKGIQTTIDNLKFDASIAGLSKLEQDIATATKKILDDAAKIEEKKGFISQGFIDGSIAEVRRFKTELFFSNIVEKESQKAGEALTANIRAGTDKALAEFKRLEDGLQFPTADAAFAHLQSLANDLNFTGPLRDLQSLSEALKENETRIRAAADGQINSERAVQAEIEKTNALIKQRFQEDQKLKFRLDEQSLAKRAREDSRHEGNHAADHARSSGRRWRIVCG